MRIYDPRIGRFLSVDPITKKYPELTPYQFASNRPIDGVDLDGKEYLNSTTVIGVGGGGAAGVGFGFRGEIQVCKAHDMIGQTFFVQAVALHPGNQDLDHSSEQPKPIFGADIGADVSFQIIREPTFLQATNVKGAEIPLEKFEGKIKWGWGAGITLGPKVIGGSFGYGAGLSLKMGDQDDVLASASITYDEAKQYGVSKSIFWASQGTLDERDGKKVFKSQISHIGADGKIEKTGLNVYADAKEVKNDKGIVVGYESSHIYKSDAYSKEEKKYAKKTKDK